MKRRLQIFSIFLSGIALALFLLIPVSIFALDAPGGDEIIYQGLKKASEKVKESLKPENRQRQRQRMYHEHQSSYSPTESAKGGDYWQKKNKRDEQLFKDAYVTDHSKEDRESYNRYKTFHRVMIGPVWEED